MRISDWSSDVCSSDLMPLGNRVLASVASSAEPGVRSRKAASIGELVSVSAVRESGIGILNRRRRRDVRVGRPCGGRSEEHTSELQSLMRISYAVFCLKKKTQKYLV